MFILNKLKNSILFIVILLFFANLIYYVIYNDIFIDNFVNNLEKIFVGMLNPVLNQEVMEHVLLGIINTLFYAYLGLNVGVFIALLCSYFSLKYRKLRFGKILAICLRAPHELIIVLILTIIFGFNVYVAVLAIGLSFGGVIAKVFTDNYNNLVYANFINYQKRGFDYMSNFFFNLFPKGFKNNLDYVIYRFECAFRSSIVLSYIGIVGIGFFINTSLSDSNYSLLFTYLYFLILTMVVIDFLSRKITQVAMRNIIKTTLIAFLIFMISLVVFTIINWSDFLLLFNEKNLYGLEKLLKALKNVLLFKSEVYSKDNLQMLSSYTLQTLQLGLLSITLLIIGVTGYLYLIIIKIKNSSKILEIFFNLISISLRSIPELVIMVILLFIFKPNIFTGALALAIHHLGVQMKLYNNLLHDNYREMILSYSKRNFTALNILVFVIYPQIKRQLVSMYTYRYELIIKSSVVVGTLGAGGLGYLFKLSLSSFNYELMILIVIIYCLLFFLIEFCYFLFQKYL